MQDFIAGSRTDRVHVISPDTVQLRQVLENSGATLVTPSDVRLGTAPGPRVDVGGLPAAEIGRLAKQHGIELRAAIGLFLLRHSSL